MKKKEAEDYYLYVNLQSETAVVERVPCKVYLPKRFSEPVILKFRPSNEQITVINNKILPQFSVEGEQKDWHGQPQTWIHTNEVWALSGIAAAYWGKDLMEVSDFTGNPVNLEIVNFLSPRHSVGKSHGRFFLTPCSLLNPGVSIGRSYTGAVEVETVWQQAFTLSNGLHLTFSNCYHYEELDNDEVVTFKELVAEFTIDDEEIDSSRINQLRSEVDDFLLLASFAARQRCVCYGWDVSNSKVTIDFFRGAGLSIPQEKGRTHRDWLIDIADSQDFIRTAYEVLSQRQEKESIRGAIHAVVPVGTIFVEKQFMASYAAVESLVLAFRKEHQLEKVLPASEWKRFSRDFHCWLQTHELLSGNAEKQKLVFSKMGELNRISFGTAFKAFCEFYGVDISDLWPLTDSSEGISLSGIRNKIVHGERLGEKKLLALSVALSHLQWSLERILLAVLDYPIAKSAVSKGRIKSCGGFEEMKIQRETLSKPAATI